MAESQKTIDESTEEQESQSMLMRLVVMAKRKMAQREADEAERAQEALEQQKFESRVARFERTEAENAKKASKVETAAKLGKNNPLYILKQKYAKKPVDTQYDALYADFMLGHKEPIADERRCIQSMQRMAQQTLQSLNAQEEALRKDPEKILEPMPARFYVQSTGNQMRAWGFVFAPVYGGAPVTEEMIRSELAKLNIVYGIDDAAIAEVVLKRQYFVLFPVALGKPPVNGKDGRIEEYFLRKVNFRPQDNDDGSIDYKNLNWIQNVEAGSTICDIIPPTEAVDGVNIQGMAVPGRDGKAPIPPKGKNTEVTEDGLRLIASVSGQVEFNRNQFNVEQLLTIRGDVDSSTGNIDVLGNVIITGNVRDGFIVKATGDITIKGQVEGAIIMAGGNVQIGMGMNGGLTGTLEAVGDIRTKYLENCTAHAGGCVYSDSVVNSNVSSDQDIDITFGLGAVIGGTIMAAHSISAKLIGNKSNRTTSIILGGTPGLLKEKSETETELNQITASIAELRKNLDYLAKAKTLTPEYKKIQNSLKLKLSTENIRLAKMKKRLDEIQSNLNPENCRLNCKIIYPVTQITIGSATRIIREPSNNCCVFYARGEVCLGSI